MAEVLAVVSLASAIVQFVAFGAKVVERLEDFQRRAGEVPKAFRGFQIELPLLVEILQQTKTRSETCHTSKEEQKRINDVVQDCFSQIELLNEILAKTLPEANDSSMRLGRKVLRRVRQGGKVNQITKTLRRHVQLLTFYQTSSLSQIGPSVAKALFMVPFVRDDNFIDCQDIMEEIRQKLTAHRRVALVGIGGVGKSQIAIEYCYRFRDANPNHSVFWAHVGTLTKFDRAYKDIARNLSLPGWDSPQSNTLQLVTDWLNSESSGHWVLVMDNADDKEVFFGPKSRSLDQQTEQTIRLFEYLPTNRKGSIIVTTRDRRIGNLICDNRPVISITVLDPQKSEAMLQSRLPKAQWSKGDAQDLIARLDHLPLAITQAAAFINNNNISIGEYLDLLHKGRLGAVDLLSMDSIDSRRDLDAPSSVIQTWKISFDRIRNEEPKAADVLSLMAVFDRQGIPKTLLTTEGEDVIELTSALGTLQAFSLITAETGGASFEMHRLVQLSTRKWLDLQDTIKTWQEAALVKISRVFPEENYKSWVASEMLSPHAHVVLQYQINGECATCDLLVRASLLHKMAAYEVVQGQYGAAFGHSNEALIIRKKELGVTDEDTLSSATTLASVMNGQGKYKEAEEMYRDILEKEETILGWEHIDTSKTLSSLGAVLSSQGDFETAEQLYRRVLAYRERSLGQQHLLTLMGKNDLATVLERQAKYDEAEQLHRQALEGSKQALGLEHPHTIIYMDNLASILRMQEKFEVAEQMHRQVLELQETTLSMQHPSKLRTMSRLAWVLCRQRKYEAAEQMNRQVLEMREKRLGPHHPATLAIMNGLALVLRKERKYVAAEKMFRQMLEIEEMHGLQYPQQANVYHLAVLLRHRKRFDEAETMLLKVLTSNEKRYGLHSLGTLCCIREQAKLCYAQGNLDGAISLMQKAYDGTQETFGTGHPTTRRSAKWLSRYLKEKDEVVAARSTTACMNESGGMAKEDGNPDLLSAEFKDLKIPTAESQDEAATKV